MWGGGRGFKGARQCTEDVFFLFSWSPWLSDSGAQWHFTIGFPLHPLVASTLAQQSQKHNHSSAGVPIDTITTSIQISLCTVSVCLPCHFSLLLQLSWARGNTYRTGRQSTQCARGLASDPYCKHSFLPIWQSSGVMSLLIKIHGVTE